MYCIEHRDHNGRWAASRYARMSCFATLVEAIEYARGYNEDGVLTPSVRILGPMGEPHVDARGIVSRDYLNSLDA